MLCVCGGQEEARQAEKILGTAGKGWASGSLLPKSNLFKGGHKMAKQITWAKGKTHGGNSHHKPDCRCCVCRNPKKSKEKES